MIQYITAGDFTNFYFNTIILKLKFVKLQLCPNPNQDVFQNTNTDGVVVNSANIIVMIIL